MEQIPEEVMKCMNETLRTAAIAAYHRAGTREQNVALLECVRYNIESDRINYGIKHADLYDDYLNYFGFTDL